MKIVLLVDDDESARLVTRRVLERGGYTVVEARDGVEALERYSSQAVDLVLTDANMPGITGEQLIRRLTEGCPDLRFIVHSGDPLSVPPDWPFILKPCPPRELLARVLAALA